MRVELSYSGVAKNRVYYATVAKAGRPRRDARITRSKKPFATGSSRTEAIQNLMDLIGFVPHDSL